MENFYNLQKLWLTTFHVEFIQKIIYHCNKVEDLLEQQFLYARNPKLNNLHATTSLHVMDSEFLGRLEKFVSFNFVNLS